MSERVAMPALGESVTEGTVTRWLKSVGDAVEVDEPLLEVSTDKVDTEIPSPVAGTLLEILAQEDDTVEVGADLAVVGDASESSGGSDDGGGQEQAEQPADDEQTAEPAQEQEQTEQQPAQEQTEQQPAQEQTEQQAPSGGGEVSGGETVTMPALGESVTEGTVTRWLKTEGDQVEVDEPLLEVSTDKVDTEIPSPVAGVLTKILAQEDDTVEVGGELAVIGGEQGGSGASGTAEQEPAGHPEAEGSVAAAESAPEPQPESQAPTEEPERSGDDSQGEDDLGGIAKEHDRAAEESAQQEGGTHSYQEPGQASGVGTTPATGDQPQGGGQAQGGGQDVSAYVTPLVRKLAAKNNVDLASLQGTGVGGRIRKQDVLDAAKAAEQQAQAAPAAPAQQAPAPAAQAEQRPAGGAAPSSESEAKRGTTEKMSRLRKLIATRMVESLQVSAQLTTVLEVDVTKIARLRKRTKDDFLAREGTKLSFMPFFAQAAVDALKHHPIVNASVEDDTITYHASENLGVAVDTPRGLLVPVIKDAGDLNIAGLARKIADLAERTRDNRVGPDELSGATFTLTNTGSRGALFDTPIINQPNVAILGTGAVVKRPVVVADEDGGETIAIRDMVYLALSYDHRVVDGADAARFLSTMKERLEDGNFEA